MSGWFSILDNKSLIVSGVLQRADAKNQNGRVYPREILNREVPYDGLDA